MTRPERGVEYAAFPTAEYAEARSLEAAVSLGRHLGVPGEEARQMLDAGPRRPRSAAATPFLPTRRSTVLAR